MRWRRNPVRSLSGAAEQQLYDEQDRTPIQTNLFLRLGWSDYVYSFEEQRLMGQTLSEVATSSQIFFPFYV